MLSVCIQKRNRRMPSLAFKYILICEVKLPWYYIRLFHVKSCREQIPEILNYCEFSKLKNYVCGIGLFA
jgi:hypothetical protein